MYSYLLVPGYDGDLIQHALSSNVCAVVLDLEESVPLGRKHIAREIVSSTLLTQKEMTPHIIVRMNALGSHDSAADLAAIMPAQPQIIMLPPCGGCADIQHLGALLAVHEAEEGYIDGSTRIIATLFSTAHDIVSRSPLDCARSRLHGITWEAEHLSHSIGVAQYRDASKNFTPPFQLARSLTLFSAHAMQALPIDTPYVDVQDFEGLEAECLIAKRDGFGGKFALHPLQVPIINRIFSKT